MDFYRCFICEVILKDEKDFEEHLQQLSHLRFLEDRKLLSSEHLDMLILVDQFKLGKSSTPKEANYKTAGEKPDFHSCSSANQKFRDNTDGKPKFSETRSEEKASSKSAGAAMNNQNDELGVLSLECLICLKRMVSLGEVEKHMNQEAHLKLQNFKMKTGTLFKTFRCLICKWDLGSREIRQHLLIVHFKIRPDFLQSRSRSDVAFFECIRCDKKIVLEDTKQDTPHLQSRAHVKKLKASPMEYYLRCQLCDVLFKSISELQHHSKVENHKKRRKAFRFSF